MDKQVKQVLFKSRFLIMCFLVATLGLYSTHNLILTLFFLIFIFYSGYTIANRLDNIKQK